MITVIDYGAGNIGSVLNMNKHVCGTAEVARDAQGVLGAIELNKHPARVTVNGHEQIEPDGYVGHRAGAISSPKCNSHFSGWKLRVDGLL
jgi:hypothetical protein